MLAACMTLQGSLLIAKVCGQASSKFQPVFYHCQPSVVWLSEQHSSCHETAQAAQPHIQVRICCHTCSTSATAARGRQPDDWALCWASSAPGAAQRVAHKCSGRCNNPIPANCLSAAGACPGDRSSCQRAWGLPYSLLHSSVTSHLAAVT